MKLSKEFCSREKKHFVFPLFVDDKTYITNVNTHTQQTQCRKYHSNSDYNDKQQLWLQQQQQQWGRQSPENYIEILGIFIHQIGWIKFHPKKRVCVWWISIKFIHNKCVDIELTFWIWWIYEANNKQIFSRVTWWWWFRKSTLCQCYNQQDTLIHWLTGWRNEWMNVAGSNLTLFRFDSCCLLETKT